MIPLYESNEDQPQQEDAFERDLIEMSDDEGNTILLEVIDYFFYNGEEYAILADSVDEDSGETDAACAHDDETDEAEEITCYVMKVNTITDENGEELEEFIPVEDQALEAKLMEIASTHLNDDDLDEEIGRAHV